MAPTDFVSNSAPHVSPCVNRAKSPNVKGSAVSGGRKTKTKSKTVKSADSDNGRTFWTPEEDARVIELREKGMSNPAIGRVMGRSACGIGSRITILIQQGRLVSARSARPYTDDEDDKLLRLCAAHFSNAEIAEILSRSVDSIQARLRLLRSIGKPVPERENAIASQAQNFPSHQPSKSHFKLPYADDDGGHLTLFRAAVAKLTTPLNALYREIRDSRTGEIFFIERETPHAG